MVATIGECLGMVRILRVVQIIGGDGLEVCGQNIKHCLVHDIYKPEGVLGRFALCLDQNTVSLRHGNIKRVHGDGVHVNTIDFNDGEIQILNYINTDSQTCPY